MEKQIQELGGNKASNPRGAVFSMVESMGPETHEEKLHHVSSYTSLSKYDKQMT